MPKEKRLAERAPVVKVPRAPAWFAIMLDYELDLTTGYWPVRAPSLVLQEVEQEMWIVGNPRLLPSQDWNAQLLSTKSLADDATRSMFSGGIYRFSPANGPQP